MSDSKSGDSASKEKAERSGPSSAGMLYTSADTGQQPASGLGKTDEEDEAAHLRRVAQELGGANSRSLVTLEEQLHSADMAARRRAAAALGTLGDRAAIALLRGLLEGDRPEDWELAVFGLRQNRDRSGWLCLESVALDFLHTLAGHEGSTHAFRLLVMGRTKTMDRLFRAIDGHSRSIPVSAARAFTQVAVASVPAEMSRVMALRLGITDDGTARPLTPEQVSEYTGVTLEQVRKLEAQAWETVQRPRTYREIRRNYEENDGRLWSSD